METLLIYIGKHTKHSIQYIWQLTSHPQDGKLTDMGMMDQYQQSESPWEQYLPVPAYNKNGLPY